MTKSLVTKVYAGGFVVWLIGLIVVFASHQNGAGAAIGFILAGLGGLALLIGWIIALVLTAQARRWGWFVALLVLGLIGLQLIIMLIYLIAGPREAETAMGPAPMTTTPPG
jgi:hypothetical protein